MFTYQCVAGLDCIVSDAMASEAQPSEGQTWTQRQESEAENWGEVRGAFYDDAVSACAVPGEGKH